MANKPAIQWIQANPANYTVDRSKPIRAITFHHVVGSDDSAISRFQQASQVSAHFVVGDTKITQMVALENTAWTNANFASNSECITIEHEGDWRNGYRNDAVIENSAKLVAWLRTLYPGITYNRHREVSLSGTVCPADLPVEEIWGRANTILNPPAPTPPPAPPAPALAVTDIQNKIVVTNKEAKLWDLSFTTWSGAKSIKVIPANTEVEVSATAKHPLGGTYYLTEYSYSKGIMNGINIADCTDKITPVPPTIPPVVPPTPPPVEPPKPPTKDEEQDARLSALEKTVETLKKLVDAIIAFISKPFNKE